MPEACGCRCTIPAALHAGALTDERANCSPGSGFVLELLEPDPPDDLSRARGERSRIHRQGRPTGASRHTPALIAETVGPGRAARAARQLRASERHSIAALGGLERLRECRLVPSTERRKPAVHAGFVSVERRGRDLNPRRTLKPETVFETAAFDRSATPPSERTGPRRACVSRRRRDSNPRWSHSAP